MFHFSFRRANQVLEAETHMFEKYLHRVEPKDAGISHNVMSHSTSSGQSGRDDHARMTHRKRSKSRSSNMDRSLKLSAEQKCDIAQREIEELREEIEKLKEESEKVLDTYKVGEHSSTFITDISTDWPYPQFLLLCLSFKCIMCKKDGC